MKRLTLCACLLTLIVGLVWANPKGAYRAAPDPVTLYGAICVFLHARRRCVCQRKLLLLFSIYEKECSNSHQVGKI